MAREQRLLAVVVQQGPPRPWLGFGIPTVAARVNPTSGPTSSGERPAENAEQVRHACGGFGEISASESRNVHF